MWGSYAHRYSACKNPVHKATPQSTKLMSLDSKEKVKVHHNTTGEGRDIVGDRVQGCAIQSARSVLRLF